MNSLKANSSSLARAAERLLEPAILFPAMAVLLLAVIWGSTLHLVSIERASAVAKADDSSNELLETYEAQMARNLALIGQALRTTQYAWELGKTDAQFSELSEHALLPPALVFMVNVANRNGTIVASTRASELGRAIPRAAFPEYGPRESEATFVSAPLRLSPEEAPRLVFSRRLNTADGHFDGIAMVAVEPAYFTSGYDTARLGKSGLLGLVDAEGRFAVKRSGDAVTWGQQADLAATAAARQPVPDGVDGVRRLLRSRALHGAPLTVVVGLSVQEQLSLFEHDRRMLYWKAGAASAFLIVLLAMLGRLSWQLSATKRRSRKIQQTYYAASNATLDAFIVLRNVRDSSGAIVDFSVEDANRRALVLFGQSRETMIGRSLCEAMPESLANGILQELQQVALNNRADESEWQNHNPNIGAAWLQRQFVAVDDGVVAILRDISERKRAELLHVEQARLLELIATGTPLPQVLDHILGLIASQLPGTMGAVHLVNPQRDALTLGAALGLPPAYLSAVANVPIAEKSGSCGTAAHRLQTVIVEDIASDPLWRDYSEVAAAHGLRACASTPILSELREVLGTFALYYRTTHAPSTSERELVAFAARLAGIAIERQQAADRIGHMAHHDALTGLPNRTLLDDRIRQALLQAQRHGRQMTVLFIDLDNFKLINDTLGHNAGDVLLRTVAERMTGCVRTADTVIRLGGDEFVIVLADQALGLDSLTQPLQKIHRAVAQPVLLAGKETIVTCSIGMASYPADGADPDSLLMHADAAMYRAKQLGRNNVQHYTAEMHQAMQEKIQLQDGLRNALGEQQFFLVYQPQIDLRSGAFIGVEALIRWQHPVLGIVPPGRFIPLTEESSLIVQIGDWVLRTACRQNQSWQRAGLPPCVVSVNVSARQFREGSLLASVAGALEQSGLAPEWLELELTESLIMQDPEQAIATMHALREMGVRLSIDDFGTGYSSLSALQHFPIARLKLDGSFVRALGESEDSRTITKAMILLGHQLGLKVVAECVETVTQREFLCANDCDEMQGYLFSKPVDAAAISALLATYVFKTAPASFAAAALH